MSSTYRVNITKQGVEQRNGLVRSAYGSLKLVAQAVKEGLAEIEGASGQFSASFVEATDAGDREVVQIESTADIVKLVLNERLKQERKQPGGAGEPTEQDSGLPEIGSEQNLA